MTRREWLKSRRDALGLTQEEVANRISVARQNYAAYEAGEKRPSWRSIVALSGVFGQDIFQAFAAEVADGQDSSSPDLLSPSPYQDQVTDAVTEEDV